eukprot:5605515-Karenia_brevis.AAC.1
MKKPLMSYQVNITPFSRKPQSNKKQGECGANHSYLNISVHVITGSQGIETVLGSQFPNGMGRRWQQH